MGTSNFENLRIYQLAEELADEVWAIVEAWNTFSKDTMGKQVVRSADSVGANIAEGVGRWGIQDHKRFIYIARGSVNETKHWLRRAYKRGLLTSEQVDRLAASRRTAAKIERVREFALASFGQVTTIDQRRSTI